jgi:hypothetical protein
MDSTEIYTLYAAAALVGLLSREGEGVEDSAHKADYAARLMIALQAKWAAECGL